MMLKNTMIIILVVFSPSCWHDEADAAAVAAAADVAARPNLPPDLAAVLGPLSAAAASGDADHLGAVLSQARRERDQHAANMFVGALFLNRVGFDLTFRLWWLTDPSAVGLTDAELGYAHLLPSAICK